MNCCKAAILVMTLLLAPDLGLGEQPLARRLTHDGLLKRDPHFIRGGAELIYCYDESPDLIRMMRLDPKTGKSEPFFQDSGNKHHIEPKVSPDGRYMSFTECTGNLTAQLVIRHLTTGKDAYVRHSGRGGTRSPVFTPDGKRVVYAFAETGPQQLWSVNLEGKDKKQLSQVEGICNWPTITPDNKRLVFANSRENNYEIYVVNRDGSNEQRLTQNQTMDIRPSVSPDGTRIAFTTARDGNYEIYVMNLDGSGVKRLTNHPERDDYPTWHPNGRELVVVSERNGEFDLYRLEVPSTSAQIVRNR